MADLALAIVGVAATGFTASKALYDLYNNIQGVPAEVVDIANDLKLMTNILRNLKHTVKKRQQLISREGLKTAKELLDTYNGPFEEINAIIRMHKPEGQGRLGLRLGLVKRISWRYKRTKVLLLRARIESLNSMLQLMIGVLQLRADLNSAEDNQKAYETLPHVLPSFNKVNDAVRQGAESVENLRLLELADTYRSTHAQYTNDARVRPAPSGQQSISEILGQKLGMDDEGSTTVQASMSTTTLLSSAAISSAVGSDASVETIRTVSHLLDQWTMTDNANGIAQFDVSKADLVVKEDDSTSEADADQTQQEEDLTEELRLEKLMSKEFNLDEPKSSSTGLVLYNTNSSVQRSEAEGNNPHVDGAGSTSSLASPDRPLSSHTSSSEATVELPRPRYTGSTRGSRTRSRRARSSSAYTSRQPNRMPTTEKVMWTMAASLLVLGFLRRRDKKAA